MYTNIVETDIILLMHSIVIAICAKPTPSQQKPNSYNSIRVQHVISILLSITFPALLHRLLDSFKIFLDILTM
jgi:hypothetical protein